MIPKQAQPQPRRACPMGICQGGGQEGAPLLGFSECGDLVSCGDHEDYEQGEKIR